MNILSLNVTFGQVSQTKLHWFSLEILQQAKSPEAESFI